MKSAAALVVLLFCSGCDSAVPVTANNASSGPLTLRLDVPQQLSAGMSMPVKLTLRNTSSQPVELTLGGRPPYDFVVTTEDGAEVARWSKENVSQAILEMQTLNAGDQLEYSVEWAPADGALRPGSYLVRGIVNLDPPGKIETASMPFRVSSAREP